jgi:hypothetical protein
MVISPLKSKNDSDSAQERITDKRICARRSRVTPRVKIDPTVESELSEEMDLQTVSGDSPRKELRNRLTSNEYDDLHRSSMHEIAISDPETSTLKLGKC